MKLKISGGIHEQGIVIGNAYDKYFARNPIVKWLMKGFEKTLDEMVTMAHPRTIHEIGCGEGYWVLRWLEQGYNAHGCDFSEKVISLARHNAVLKSISPDLFKVKSIYDLNEPQDGADLLVCLETLEHLDQPNVALQVLSRVVERFLILSVPREPLWRLLNLARGKYISDMGNTTGHIQHWSSRSFVDLISQYFEIIRVETPTPWTMVFCQRKG